VPQIEAAVLQLPLSCTQSSLERTKSVLRRVCHWVVFVAMEHGVREYGIWGIRSINSLYLLDYTFRPARRMLPLLQLPLIWIFGWLMRLNKTH